MLGLGALLGVACLYDGDDRCRSSRLFQDGLCVCPEGTVDRDGQCVTKTAAPSGLGVACNAATPCESDEFSICQATKDPDGYCTKQGCVSDEDCGGDYYCAKDAPEQFCKRTPTGLGMSCASQADCASFDADYCVIAGAQSQCSVANCVDDDGCPPGLKCQDLTVFLPGTPKLCAPPL